MFRSDYHDDDVIRVDSRDDVIRVDLRDDELCAS